MTIPASHLLQAVTERLLPLFQTEGGTPDQAREAAREAIAAYNPESSADYAHIARILAFSLAAIAAIGKSAAPDLPPNLQLRFLGKANTLSRSADQAERAMTIRRQQKPQPLPEPQPKPKPHPEARQPTLKPNPADAAILAQIDSAIAEYRTLVPDLPVKSFRNALRQQVPMNLLRATG